MRKLLIIAAASMLCAVPAVAQQSESGSSISGSEHMHRNFGGMRGDLGERLGEHKTYGYDRDSDMRDMHRRGDREDYRSHHGEDMGMGAGMHMREGCKYITVRQRQGDEIIVRHFRRCD